MQGIRGENGKKGWAELCMSGELKTFTAFLLCCDDAVLCRREDLRIRLSTSTALTDIKMVIILGTICTPSVLPTLWFSRVITINGACASSPRVST